MPEAYVSATVEIKRSAPSSISLYHGIGDSDDFPVFDNGDADNYSTPHDMKWGFRITGGAEFKMSITVFQVTEGGLAEQEGIRLGDIILEINGIDTSDLTLAQAHNIIENTESVLKLVATNMDEEDNVKGSTSKKSVTLRAKVQEKPVESQKESSTQNLERKAWHPVVWQQPPPPPTQEYVPGQELPHHRIIRNIKRFFKETEDKPEMRQKYIEDMLLALPGASKSG